MKIKNKEHYERILKKYFQGLLIDNSIDRDKIITVQLDDDSSLEMKASHFLVNLILWNPVFAVNGKITKEYVFDCSKVNSDTLGNYFDKIINDFIDKDNASILNKSIGFSIEHLGLISYYFNPLVGNTISIYDKIKLAERNPEYNDIIHTTFSEDTPSYEVEKQTSEKLTRLIDILKVEDNNVKDYLNAKEGINLLQLSQFEINVGNRPSLTGKTIPRPVNSNFLRGLQLPSDYYIEALSGRKAAIINNSEVKRSGYLNRKLSILCIGHKSEFDVEDCGTKNYVSINIENENILERLNNRHYVDKKGNIKTIDSSKDKNLIGKTIQLRSPITCACKNGVCRTCYGKKHSYLNGDIHIGLISVMELTSRMSQMLISAKHLLKTTSEKIEWPEHFLDFFAAENNSIIMNNEILPKMYEIEIHTNELYEVDDETGDMESNHYINEFKIIHKNNKTGKSEKYNFNLDKNLYLTKSFEDTLNHKGIKDNGKIILNFKYINEDEPIFLIEISNEELSSHLRNVFSLIESKEMLGIRNYSEMLQRFNQFLIKGKINIQSIHPEMIIRAMVRDVDNNSLRPDFSQEGPDYQILRVSDAIMNSPSLIERLSFEKIRMQFSNPEIFEVPSKTSLFDNLFKNKVEIGK